MYSKTFVQVLNEMRCVLRKKGYSQIPQLTSNVPMNVTKTNFYLVPKNSGNRYAVLIGINYVDHKQGQLSGCHNDVWNMKEYIMNVWGYKESNIQILMDDGYHTPPTRENILQAYRNVISQAKSSDVIFLHYSGHGGRVRDDDWGEEEDGYDETLVPVDYDTAGQIRDDDLYDTLIDPLPPKCHLISVMDCCHSGTVLDLPYKYTFGTNGEDGDDDDEYDDDGKYDNSNIVSYYGGQIIKRKWCTSKTLCIIICIAITAIVYAVVMLVTRPRDENDENYDDDNYE